MQKKEDLLGHDRYGCRNPTSGTDGFPTIVNVEEARTLYLEQNAQAIIAFGGGSSMDCAKAAGARIVKPHQSVSQMKGLLHVHKRLPLLIAVPTTAGTGSETTLAAVITDGEKHHKYPINDFSLIPRHADQEGNPLYPVPVLMNRKELERIYHRVKSA